MSRLPAPPPLRPTIALITDFGLQDHYVGVMKGVLATLCPDANVIDITHAVPPQDVLSAALELHAAAPYFPAKTIFLVVVDPGVGTGRRALAVEAGDRVYVAPDNGVLDLALRGAGGTVAWELGSALNAYPVVGRTFEGRDRFAPAAARLACGTPLSALGTTTTWVARLAWPAPRETADGLEGEIVHVDRFGNLVSNIERRHVEAGGGAVSVEIGVHGPARLVTTYGDAAEGDLVALCNSANRLEIAVVGGDAASRLAVGRGAEVRVRRRA